MKKILLAATAALLLGGNAIADDCFGLPQWVVDNVMLEADAYCKKSSRNPAKEATIEERGVCIRIFVPGALEGARYEYAIEQAKQRQSKQ